MQNHSPNNRINSDWQFRCAPLPASYAERSVTRHRMSEFSRRLFILGMVGASVVIFVPSAWGRRRRPRVRIPGPGLIEGDRHSGPILSRDQLRSCVIQQDSINANADILERDEAVLAGQAKRIEGLGDALERRLVSVDAYSQASVDAYNRRSRSTIVWSRNITPARARTT
jgi:hypothetical protein